MSGIEMHICFSEEHLTELSAAGVIVYKQLTEMRKLKEKLIFAKVAKHEITKLRIVNFRAASGTTPISFKAETWTDKL